MIAGTIGLSIENARFYEDRKKAEEEYRGIFEKDHALARRFQKIDIEEPSIDEAVDTVLGTQFRFRSVRPPHFDAAISQPLCPTSDVPGNEIAHMVDVQMGKEQLIRSYK